MILVVLGLFHSEWKSFPAWPLVDRDLHIFLNNKYSLFFFGLTRLSEAFNVSNLQ